MAKLEAIIGDQKHIIELKETENGRALIGLGDNHTVDVDVRQVESDVWSLIIDGESYEATVQPLTDKLRITIRGATWDIDIYDPRVRGVTKTTRATVEGAQTISSPMPGRVVTINVAVGDKIEAGQGVIIVEAMKMENELQAEGAGVVTEIKVKPGQAVEDGQALVVIQ